MDETDGGCCITQTRAVAVFVASAFAAAVMLMNCVVGLLAGLVYKPVADNEPAMGDIVQLTPGLGAFETVAWNCWF